MKRRKFLAQSAAGAGSVAAAATIGAPAIAQERKEMVIVSSWGRDFPGLGISAQRLAERITAMSGGRITTQYFAAGERVGAFDVFDAVASGNAQAYVSAEYYWKGKNPAFGFFTSVPFGLTYTEQGAWIFQLGGQQLWDELSAGYGLKALPCGNTGVQMGGWFRKEINTVDDLKGLKMRIPGLGGDVMAKCGASPVSLPGGQIYENLVSGAIDATEWVGPWQDLAAGFYKVAKYYYWPGMHEPATLNEITVNKAKFDALPKDVQQIFAWGCGDEQSQLTAENDASNSGALEVLIKQHNVQLKKLPDEFIKAYGKAVAEVMKEMRDSGDEITKKTLDSYYKFQREQMAWTRIGLQEYLNARLIGFQFT